VPVSNRLGMEGPVRTKLMSRFSEHAAHGDVQAATAAIAIRNMTAALRLVGCMPCETEVMEKWRLGVSAVAQSVESAGAHCSGNKEQFLPFGEDNLDFMLNPPIRASILLPAHAASTPMSQRPSSIARELVGVSEEGVCRDWG
jgi:hypothetical protein